MPRVKSKLHQPQSSVSDGCVEICMVKMGSKSIMYCEGIVGLFYTICKFEFKAINGLEYYCSKVLI